MVPSLLLIKDTKLRILNLKSGLKALIFLPITLTGLVFIIYFAFNLVSQFPILNLSWLGYNLAIGPYANQGYIGILPFLPFLVYTSIHVNYFEEYYFRKNYKRVIAW